MTASGERARILIVDDERQIRWLLSNLLSEQHECAEADSAEKALELIGREKFDLVLSDITMDGITGLEMIPRVLELAPDAVVIMVSAESNIESAIEAMRAGAFDYVTKPFDFRQVEVAVRRGLEHRALLDAKRRYERDLEELVQRRTEELNHAVSHDGVTSLPNRVLFNDRLGQAVSAATKGGQTLAVMLLDLDRLKAVNESLGYAAGDRLLRVVAERVRGCLGGDETVARFGGDELSLLTNPVRGAAEVAAMAGSILEALGRPVELDGHEVYVTASVGVALFPHDGDDAEALLSRAAAAMYTARGQGGNCFRFYSADMEAEALKRLSLECDLRRALERGEIILHYQPQVEMATGRVVGAEALVRWQHPRQGLIPPAEFIPLAEATGLIVPIGEWVLRAAIRQCGVWQEGGLAPLRVAVNLSARQFQQPDLVEMVRGSLAEAGFEPGRLELEITESSVVSDRDVAVAALRELRAMGVRVAIDDFGTGHSSLSHLKHLPVDTLKIDRSFIRDMAADPNDEDIVGAVVKLGHSLGLNVTAEGVEEEAQSSLLGALGCDEAQGYLFGRALPPDDFEKLLRGKA
ncbi:MAG: EAL domain-containing protein [Acidobacteriota bacterium]|nr:EAL domain-containing protein [Acidobacteriota bacterium]MDQ5835633.1 EAL domain-containing protein [Acidobacteriota bacterium]